MKDILRKLCGKIVKIYLRNDQTFAARIMSVEEFTIHARSQYADIYIRIEDISAITLQLDTPLADVPTKSMYHPKNRRC